MRSSSCGATAGSTCSTRRMRVAGASATTSSAWHARAGCFRHPGSETRPIQSWPATSIGGVPDMAVSSRTLRAARSCCTTPIIQPTSSTSAARASLDEVTWSADRLARHNGGRGPSAAAALPGDAVQRSADASVDDGFAAARLDSAWQWPWDQPVAPRAIAADGGWLCCRRGHPRASRRPHTRRSRAAISLRRSWMSPRSCRGAARAWRRLATATTCLQSPSTRHRLTGRPQTGGP